MSAHFDQKINSNWSQVVGEIKAQQASPSENDVKVSSATKGFFGKICEFFSGLFRDRYALTSDEAAGLHAVTVALQGNNLSETEKAELSKVLEAGFGNENLNKRLQKRGKKLVKQDALISKEAVSLLTAYSFKTTKSDKYNDVASRLEALWAAVESGTVDTDTKKLNISEVRNIESMLKLGESLEQLELAEGSKAAELATSIKKTAGVYESVLSQLEKESKIPSGSILIYDVHQAMPYMGKKKATLVKWGFTKLMGVPATHLATALRNPKNGQLEESHMWGKPLSIHQIARRSLSNHVFRAVAVDWDKVFPKHIQQELKALYGDDWQKTVEEMAAKHADRVHRENPRAERLKNPTIRRLAAFMGARWSLTPNNWRQTDFSGLNHAICSEFTLLTSLKALAELEQEMKSDFVKSGRSDKDLKDLGEWIKLPIRRHRYLRRVTPSDVVERSLSITSPVDYSQTLKKVMDFPGFNP